VSTACLLCFKRFTVEADHRNSAIFVEHKLEIFSIIGQQSPISLMTDLIGDFLLIGVGASQLFIIGDFLGRKSPII